VSGCVIDTETSGGERQTASLSDDDSELPPNDFSVSPPAMSPSTSLLSSDAVDVSLKKGTYWCHFLPASEAEQSAWLDYAYACAYVLCLVCLRTVGTNIFKYVGCSVAEWLMCWTQAQKGPGSNRSRAGCRVTVLGKLFTPIVPLFTKQQNW